MKAKLRVWIVEDKDPKLRRARWALQQACSKSQYELHEPIVEIKDFKFPEGPLPDIVILDLMIEDERGLTLCGNQFYNILRNREEHKPENEVHSEAFVIIWSGYTGDHDADEFVNRISETGLVVICKTADKIALREALCGVMARIEEERWSER